MKMATMERIMTTSMATAKTLMIERSGPVQKVGKNQLVHLRLRSPVMLTSRLSAIRRCKRTSQIGATGLVLSGDYGAHGLSGVHWMVNEMAYRDGWHAFCRQSCGTQVRAIGTVYLPWLTFRFVKIKGNG